MLVTKYHVGIYGLLVHWFRFLVSDSKTCIALAFEAIASSSGDIQTLIDKIISQDHTIRQTKSESEESEAFDFDFQNY